MAIVNPGRVHARANPSTAQTNAVIVAARSNAMVNVHFVYFSSDTELVVTLVNSVTHSVIHRQYVGARGGQGTPINVKTIYGEGVDFTTSVDGNVYVDIEYSYTR